MIRTIACVIGICFCIYVNAQSGNVGIGTNNPLARLHVADSSVLFTGPATLPIVPGNPPFSGFGHRMFWYTDKAAFRIGRNVGYNTERDSIGYYSFGAGDNVQAKGDAAVAFGANTYAGDFSAVAFGFNNRSEGQYTFSVGVSNTSYGQGSFTAGLGSVGIGQFSVAIGSYDTNSGYASICLGHKNKASSDYSSAIGHNNKTSGIASFVHGELNVVNGSSSFGLGYNNKVNGLYSFAAGSINNITGAQSFALGALNNLNNDQTLAVGNENSVSGYLGMAIGRGLQTKSVAGTTMGTFNDISDVPGGITQPTDRIFQIGNGSNSGARNNAVTILRNGNVGIGALVPAARLHVHQADVLFTGEDILPDPAVQAPASGSGSRMMWFAERSAFRVGRSVGTNWNTDSIGNFSFAGGEGTKAKGAHSFAFGLSSVATGMRSTALGFNSIASGASSFAAGGGNSATADGTVAIGSGNQSTAAVSTSIGNNNIASGYATVGIGEENNVQGENSSAVGGFNLINGIQSSAIGISNFLNADFTFAGGNSNNVHGLNASVVGSHLTVKANYASAVGAYNDIADAPTTVSQQTDRIFQIGNGVSQVTRKNALTVLRSGNIGIGELTPGHLLSFDEVHGSKISLWGQGAAHYGFGIQPNTLQIFTDNAGADVAFGHGTSTALTKTLVVMGNGRLNVDPNSTNVGNTSTPVLAFGSFSGEAIGSKRTAGGNQYGLDFYTNNINRMTVLNNGNIGINTLNPTDRLQVAGNVRADAFLTPSDVRYKENIHVLQDVLSKISQVNAVTYDYKKGMEGINASKKQIGLIAQDLEKVFPELVSTDKDGYKSVDYAKLSAVLLQAVNELAAEMKEMKKMMVELAGRLEDKQ